MRCTDGTIGSALRNDYTVKVKYLHKSDTGLRFPILREIVDNTKP